MRRSGLCRLRHQQEQNDIAATNGLLGAVCTEKLDNCINLFLAPPSAVSTKVTGNSDRPRKVSERQSRHA